MRNLAILVWVLIVIMAGWSTYHFINTPETAAKPRLVGYGCVYKVESEPDVYMFVEGPTYADEEDHFPSCVTIEENL